MKNYILLALVFLLISCNKDDDELQSSTTLLDNETTFITATVSNNNINIQIEALTDTSDQTLGVFPLADFSTIVFDINNNSSIDANIDFGYASQSLQYDLCDFYLIDSTTVTACGTLNSEANFTSEFTSSERSSTEHVIWNLQVPREDLNNQSIISFRIKTYNNGIYRNHPERGTSGTDGAFSFESTYQIEL